MERQPHLNGWDLGLEKSGSLGEAELLQASPEWGQC